MQFDIFHSIGRIDSIKPTLTDRQVFEQFFDQAILAETLGFKTIWAAESHFSSEVQKRHEDPVIPNYKGEVGLNNDSPQLASWLFHKTKSIGFGTAIFNIVGGNGGPIGAADRIRSLAFLNSLQPNPRQLDIGVAAGRFPYINKPYGIVPRSEEEQVLWEAYKRLIFMEALEIFLRLSNSEILSSADITKYTIDEKVFGKPDPWQKAVAKLGGKPTDKFTYHPRWNFEPMQLVPKLSNDARKKLNFVLGSSCSLARGVGAKFCDMDIFNLSFTDPTTLNRMHAEMGKVYTEQNRQWHRGRMPRTVLIFIDKNPRLAQEMASAAFDTYIEAMEGTVGTPPKSVLMERALIGDAAIIRDQLSPSDPHGFCADDRLMLWFEFNQADSKNIQNQMRYFADHVMPYVTK